MREEYLIALWSCNFRCKIWAHICKHFQWSGKQLCFTKKECVSIPRFSFLGVYSHLKHTFRRLQKTDCRHTEKLLLIKSSASFQINCQSSRKWLSSRLVWWVITLISLMWGVCLASDWNESLLFSSYANLDPDKTPHVPVCVCVCKSFLSRFCERHTAGLHCDGWICFSASVTLLCVS